MKTKLTGLILVFSATYFLMLNSVLANVLATPFPGKCTPNPTTLTLKTGATAQVAYKCIITADPKANPNYKLTFTSTPSGLTVTPPAVAKPNPYPVTIKAGQTTGAFTVKIHTLNLGTGPLLVTNQTPLTVTVPSTRIFSEVVTNRLSIQGAINAPLFGGAFVFQNNTTNSITGLQTVIQTLSTPFEKATCNQVTNLPARYTYTECSSLHGTLPSGATCAACFIEKSAAQPSKNSYTFSGKLKYTGGSTTASKTIPTLGWRRFIQLYNYCPGPIWVAAISTKTAYRHCDTSSECPAGTKCVAQKCQVPAPTNGTSCTNTSDCPTGSYCASNGYCSKGCTKKPNVCPQLSTCSSRNGLCYWNVPTLSTLSGHSKINAGGFASFLIHDIAKNPSVNDNVWQGSIVARTGCSIKKGVFSCVTGNCGNTGKSSTCPIGQPPAQPVTQAKFSLQLKSKDSYYVDISNGFNIPISIAVPGSSIRGPSYVCGMAGTPVPGTPADTGAAALCQWSFNLFAGSQLGTTSPSSKEYVAYHRFVTKGATPCNAPNYTCSTGVCGISQENVNKSSPTLTCGKLIGFWSTLALCSANPSAYNAVLDCNNSSPTKLDWLRCSPGSGGQGASCYAIGAKKNKCCGCPYWQVGNSNYPYLKTIYTGKNLQVISPRSNNESCQKDTKYWINQALLPDLIWMKQGCPTVKVFPKDSATSLFNCKQTPGGSSKINIQNYQIAFCTPPKTGYVGKPGAVQGTPVYVPTNPHGTQMHQESLLKRIMDKLAGYVSFVEH